MRSLATVMFIAVLLAQAGCARHAQEATAVQIRDVHVGFPAGASAGQNSEDAGRYFKPGEWAPVVVDVTAGPEGLRSDDAPYELTTATADNDNILSIFPVSLPPLGPNEQTRVLTYVKPCGTRADLTVGVRKASATAGVPRQNASRAIASFRQSPQAMDIGENLYLVAGMAAPGLQQALERTNETSATKYRSAHVDATDPLPADWFGYASIDLLCVGTADSSFVDRLLQQPVQRDAVARWIRQGGRLLLSTGRHPEAAQHFIEQLKLNLPVEISGKKTVSHLDAVEIWLRERQPPPMADVPGGLVDIARLRPAFAADTVISQKSDQAHDPLVVRCACGMGEVTLIAFDVDQPPFAGWPTEAEFWYKLLNIPRPAPETAAASGHKETPEEAGTDLAAMLQNQLEQFRDVPVVSFGLVAFLMFVYIMIVGPLDFFVLRRFARRLELTWVTFPVMILIVSGLAYGTAYQLKGNQVRINKLDLVDVDFHSGRVMGTSWFSLFSPRNQDLSLSLEPAAGWTKPGDRADAPLSWLARPETSFGGYGRTRVQGFVRSSYHYDPQAAGLANVPAAAWSDKSFTARWSQPLDRQHPPVEADLRQRGDGPITGVITNHLPADLEDCYLIVGGDPVRHTVFDIGTLLRDNPKRDSYKVGQQGRRLAEWLPVVTASRGHSEEPALSQEMLIRRLMFFREGSRQDHVADVPLRYLDQSWRLPLKGEVILVGRLTKTRGTVQEVAAGDAAPSALRFGSGPVPDGTMTQDTYVRMYLPLRHTEFEAGK